MRMYPKHPCFIHSRKINNGAAGQGQVEGVDDSLSAEEFNRVRQCYQDLGDKFNMKIYLNFFKSFCRLPGEHEDEVREARMKAESKWGTLPNKNDATKGNTQNDYNENFHYDYPCGEGSYTLADLKKTEGADEPDDAGGVEDKKENDLDSQKTFLFTKDQSDQVQIQDYQLRADLASLNRGLKYWYAGRSNPLLAKLLFDYFSKGKENHLITFSQFMYFLRDLKLHQYNQNMVVFKLLLKEKAEALYSHDLLRYYTLYPKNSPFHGEITKLLEFALNTYQRIVGADRHS